MQTSDITCCMFVVKSMARSQLSAMTSYIDLNLNSEQAWSSVLQQAVSMTHIHSLHRCIMFLCRTNIQ